eukprot:67928-Pyramimonas_sp.AAC.1
MKGRPGVSGFVEAKEFRPSTTPWPFGAPSQNVQDAVDMDIDLARMQRGAEVRLIQKRKGYIYCCSSSMVLVATGGFVSKFQSQRNSWEVRE